MLRSLRHGNPVPLVRWLAKRGGGITRLWFLFRSVWIVSDQDLLEKVLVKNIYDKGGLFYRIIGQALGSDGLFTTNDLKLWHRLREAANPAFTRQAVAARTEEELRVFERRTKNWDLTRSVPLLEEFKAHSVEMLLILLFGSANSEEVKRITRLAAPVFKRYGKQPVFAQMATSSTPYHQAIAELDEAVYEIIDNYRSGKRGGGLLSRFVVVIDPHSGKPLSDKQLRDQITTLLMAGHDSTAAALSVACIALARQPHTVNRLRAEIQQATRGQMPAFQHLEQLAELGSFFESILAKHPSFPLFPRHVAADTELGGRKLKKGDLFVVVTPSRYPFGHGKRKCIGENMATIMGTLILATLLQQFGEWKLPRNASDKPPRYAMTEAPSCSDIELG
jgi:cytochrome P450